MKILAIGRNYAAHAKELNNEIPEEPIIFLKPDTALLKNNAPFYHPDFSENIHYEAELIVRICKEGKNISEKFAHKYYDGIGIGLDLTARDLQNDAKAKGMPWTLSKCFNGSAPVSEMKALSHFPDLKNISFSLKVNGELRQQGNSKDMLYTIDQIIAYISRFITLKKGDILYTGTPEGVGKLDIGDKLEAFIEEEKMLEMEVK